MLLIIYYNVSRTLRSLDKDAPFSRPRCLQFRRQEISARGVPEENTPAQRRAHASANRSVDLEREPGGARSVISTHCGVAIDPNMSMCGGVRSRASDCSDAANNYA
jgi:hypothetical protein